MLTLALDKPFSIKVIGFNGKFAYGEIEFDRDAYLKFSECVNVIITVMIWFGGVLLAIKDVPPAIQFVYNVIIIIIISLLYGFLDINIKRRW